MSARISATFAFLAMASASAIGQVSSADVSIVSVSATSLPKQFVCTVEVNNRNDDDARAARLIVLLPLQVPRVMTTVVTPGPTKCVNGPALGGFVEYVTCELGQLPVNPTNSALRTIKVTTAPSTAGANYPPTCSAFVYSQVGDIDKSNNYGWSH